MRLQIRLSSTVLLRPVQVTVALPDGFSWARPPYKTMCDTCRQEREGHVLQRVRHGGACAEGRLRPCGSEPRQRWMGCTSVFVDMYPDALCLSLDLLQQALGIRISPESSPCMFTGCPVMWRHWKRPVGSTGQRLSTTPCCCRTKIARCGSWRRLSCATSAPDGISTRP